MRKYSGQRAAILEELQALRTHPTAAELHSRVRQRMPNISLGTVYRNLALLCEEGEVQRISPGDGTDHYDAVTSPHDHFSCTGCGRLLDLDLSPLPDLDALAEQVCGGRVERHSLIFYGLCGSCTAERERTAPR